MLNEGLADVYADSMLIITPLRVLWDFKSDVAHRNLLILVFSSSIITTIFSLVHSYYILGEVGIGGLDDAFFATIEV
jgi:hypothetical protein